LFSDSAVRALDYTTGSFTVRVGVPLKRPASVPDNVDINVFVCGGDDFELHTLSLWGGIYTDPAPGKIEARKIAKRKALERADKVRRDMQRMQRDSASKQAGDKKEGSEASSKTDDVDEKPKNDGKALVLGVDRALTFDPPVHHFGESYANLRECCKRYFLIAEQRIANTTSAASLTGEFHVDFSSLGGMVEVLFNSFRCFRGPINFKIEMYSTSNNGSNHYASPATGFVTTSIQPQLFAGEPTSVTSGLNTILGYQTKLGYTSMPPLVRFSTTQVGEFQIPYQSIFHSLLIGQDREDVQVYYGNMYTFFQLLYVIDVPNTDTTDTFTVRLSAAFGDETRVGVFLGYPRITRNPAIPWPNPGAV